MSAIVFPERDFNGDPWRGEQPQAQLAQLLGLRVQVSPMLPYESMDPEKPGWVHAIHMVDKAPFTGERTGETLFVSKLFFEHLRKVRSA